MQSPPPSSPAARPACLPRRAGALALVARMRAWLQAMRAIRQAPLSMALVVPLLSLLLGGLGGCASAPPLPRGEAAAARAPAATGPLAQAEARWQAQHAEGVSGFRLLRSNDEALMWRLALVDAATGTLDLQYYVWFGDKAGQLLMSRVIAAADRGVRVRILFDDLNTMLHDMGSVESRDALLARLDRHPRIELRVFNPWRARSLGGRVLEMVEEFERLNRRMHNKQMVVDNRVAVIGGRNIGDEYFGLNPAFNFHDLDVLGLGPVARQASAVFDRYWNSEWVRRLPRLPPEEVDAARASAADEAALAELQRDARMRRILAGRGDWRSRLAQLPAGLHPGRSSVHTDSPSRAPSVHNHMPEAFRGLLTAARSEVLITNAYVIPDATFIADLQALAARGVQVRLLTNSLASHDVPAVNAHYEGWRAALLGTGARLHELRPDAALAGRLVNTAPVQGRFIGLHVKAMVIDRRHVFVGSMNLDPRSEQINSEMGVLIDSAPLAAELAEAMLADMQPANAWQLALDAQGRVQWQAEGPPLHQQPARSPWQRAQNLFFKLFPPSLY